MQANFAATEPLEKLQKLLRLVLAPGLGKAWAVYTTPPKQDIKDWQQSFYKAGFAPAANVHFR